MSEQPQPLFWQSPTTAKLDEALAKAQGKFTNPEKNRTVKVKTRTGGEYTFDYATFDNTVAMARPILSEFGITVNQFVSAKPLQDGSYLVSVTTRVAHAGEWIASEITGPVVADSIDMQKIGSGLTYLERYSFNAILNIVGETDDDGGGATGHDEAHYSERPPRTSTPTSSTPKPNCPKCGTNEHVIKGAEQYGGGWVCWKKNGGCGAKWPDEEPWSQPDDAPKVGNTSIPGVTTADKLPPKGKPKGKSQPIGHADMPFIDDCRAQVQRAKSLDELTALWMTVQERRLEIQDELKPDFTLKKGEFI